MILDNVQHRGYGSWVDVSVYRRSTWIWTVSDIRDRVRTTLRYMANELETEHGSYYHFLDMSTGMRWRRCELSSIERRY